MYFHRLKIVIWAIRIRLPSPASLARATRAELDRAVAPLSPRTPQPRRHQSTPAVALEVAMKVAAGLSCLFPSVLWAASAMADATTAATLSARRADLAPQRVNPIAPSPDLRWWASWLCLRQAVHHRGAPAACRSPRHRWPEVAARRVVAVASSSASGLDLASPLVSNGGVRGPNGTAVAVAAASSRRLPPPPPPHALAKAGTAGLALEDRSHGA